MSIFPATDIVSDVARAADPRKATIAVRRLEEAAATKGVDFTSSVASASIDQFKSFSSSAETGIRTITDTATSAAKKFEAFVMQSWLEILLPKEESGAFGTGAGANIWRSMMAEQLGSQLASVDAMGLQKALERRDPTTTPARA